MQPVRLIAPGLRLVSGGVFLYGCRLIRRVLSECELCAGVGGYNCLMVLTPAALSQFPKLWSEAIHQEARCCSGCRTKFR